METYLALACLLAPFAAALWVLPAFKTAPQVESDSSERHELRAWEEPSQLDPRPWPLKRVFEDSNNGLLAWGLPLALFTGSLITLAYVGMTSSEELSDRVALLAVPGAVVLLWSGAKLGRLLA